MATRCLGFPANVSLHLRQVPGQGPWREESDGSHPSLRALTAARLLLGSTLLVAPGPLLGVLGCERCDARVRAVARVLGARQLVQAAVGGRHRSRGWILAGAAVDAGHAMTMVIVASLDHERRRPALASALTASAMAVAGIQEARRP